MDWRDRISSVITRLTAPWEGLQAPAQPPVQPLGNAETLAKRGIYLDDFRAPGAAPYREDTPGMDERLARRQRQPFIGPEIDPRLEPPPSAVLGITPTNDPNAVTPDMVPWDTSLFGRRA
jgi:hypothetical protein